MDDLWALLGALATVILPMALAGWLLARLPGRHSSGTDPHENMRGQKDR